MARRTRPQAKTDDLAFPIRVKFRVPRDGLGRLSETTRSWLREHVGTGRFAVHNTDAIASDAVGVYFVTLGEAQEFVAAFPEMQIADGTRCKGLPTPTIPRPEP